LDLKLPKTLHAVYFSGDDSKARAILAEALAAVERGGPTTIAGSCYVVDAADIEQVSLTEVRSSE